MSVAKQTRLSPNENSICTLRGTDDVRPRCPILDDRLAFVLREIRFCTTPQIESLLEKMLDAEGCEK